MYAITATYHGATDHRGSRFTVRWGDRTRATISYDYGARDAGQSAILRALTSRRFIDGYRVRSGDRLVFATLPNGDTVATVLYADGAAVGMPFPDQDRA